MVTPAAGVGSRGYVPRWRRAAAEAGAPEPATARDESPQEAAADVVPLAEEEAGEPLPHLDLVQKSFGSHDVSRIQAHVGGAAGEAAVRLGARGYAVGDRVAFAEPPDLHTAAHEAAHVIQQRSGLPAGIDAEDHADQVADAVVRGASATSVLDHVVAARTEAPKEMVQRKAATAPGPASAPARQLAPDEHYKVVGHFAYLLDVAWYRAGAVAEGGRLVSPSKMLEVLAYLRSAGVLGWASSEALAEASQIIGIPVGLTAPEITMRIGADVLALIGLPPNSSAMVSRDGDGLRVAIRLETDGLPHGVSLPIKGAPVDAVYAALTAFTGLPIAKDARVDSFGMTVGTGAVHRFVSTSTLEDLFGKAEWTAWKAKSARGADGATETQEGARSVGHDLTPMESARLTSWLTENAGSAPTGGPGMATSRELLAMIDEIEHGSLTAHRGQILAHLRAHRATGPGTIDPVTLRHKIDEALRHALGADRSVGGTSPALSPFGEAPPAQLTYSRGLIVDTDAVTFEVAFDWAQISTTYGDPLIAPHAHDAFVKRRWHAEVEWVFERLDRPSRPPPEVLRTVHDRNELRLAHRLMLAEDEAEGTWVVHAFVHSSHFAMIRVSTQVQVKSEARRMADLRREALGNLAVPEDLAFDGHRFSGPLAFKPRSPEQRASGRQQEIAQIERVRDYLRTHGDERNRDAIHAVEKQLERRREQDEKIQADQEDGWRTFDVRGTYLSRTEEVPSGPLDIYGAARYDSVGHVPGKFVHVTLRDLSRRFEQETYVFDGYGETFEAAFHNAMSSLAKDYPKGRVAVFAEDQGPRGDQPSGRTIGFEQRTYSTWKAVKEKVFHPAAQIALATASAAIMIFAPPAAAAIPLFINTVYQSVQSADDLIHRAQNHTLSMSRIAVDMGSIGLGVLPFVSSAKAVRSSTRAMFALEVANLGGQALLMAASVKETLEVMQAQDVSTIAQMYAEMIEAEKLFQESDPRLVEMRARIDERAQAVRGRLREAFSTTVGTQLVFMVPGHVFQAIQLGRTVHESGWVPSDLGTPVEETDWHDLHREMSGDEPSAPLPPATATVPRVPSTVPVGTRSDGPSESSRSSGGQRAVPRQVGEEIAAKVPGARYEPGGVFKITIGDREVSVTVRRTSRTARIVHEAGDVILEIPTGLDPIAFEAAVVGELRTLHEGAAATASQAELPGPAAPTGKPQGRSEPPHESSSKEPTAGRGPDRGAAQLVDDLSAGKALAEQHAHVQGSVPIDAVLGLIDEDPALTPAQRAKQIDLLEELIAEATATGKDAKVADLSPRAVETKDGTVKAPRKVVIASVDGSLEVGLLNAMLKAKRAIVEAVNSADSGGLAEAKKALGTALRDYRAAIKMAKPGGTHYDAAINPGNEFFSRYKMILGHGLTEAQIAKGRTSASQLGMQELRYSPEHKGLDSMRGDAADLLEHRPDDADVSLTYATTKNRTAAEDPKVNEQGQVVEFVRAWYDDPKMQRMFNGFENAGVEHADRPPVTMWQGAAERVFRNAAVLREHLASELRTPGAESALIERLARATGTTIPEAAVTLARFREAPYEAALAATERRAAVLRAEDDALRARRKTDGSEPWHAATPRIDTRTGQMTERFGGLSLEEVGAETRAMTEALNAWSAETHQQHGEVTLLGMTMHAGEQLLNTNVDPFSLLAQVDQAVSMGVDRIGHALILGIEADVLVEKGKLPPTQRDAFVARQREVRDRVRARGVVIETNLSSNVEISNLTNNQHPAGRFVEEGLRVTVNTDDETVLGTDMAAELHRVSEARGVTRNDLATMILEGYRSRLGNRELAHRSRIKAALRVALVRGLSPTEIAAMTGHLASYFRVAITDSPMVTLTRILDVALGV